MANRNCNCAMALIQKQCPRDTFDCHRCLARMKNRGKVWQVDVETLEFPAVLPDWPAISESLYYADTEGNNQCLSVVRGENNYDGTASYGLSLPQPTGGDQRLRLELYFEETWKLYIRFERWDTTPPSGGGDTGTTYILWLGTARYASELSGCGASGVFEMQLTEVSFIKTTEPELEFEWDAPESITFQQVDNPNL